MQERRCRGVVAQGALGLSGAAVHGMVVFDNAVGPAVTGADPRTRFAAFHCRQIQPIRPGFSRLAQ